MQGLNYIQVLYTNCVADTMTPPDWNYLLEGGPIVVQASPLGECSRNHLSVSVYQLALL